jgi:hypothetical protein
MTCSHVDEAVIDSFIDWLRYKYEDVNKVKASRGPKHNYLGMTIYFLIK